MGRILHSKKERKSGQECSSVFGNYVVIDEMQEDQIVQVDAEASK